MEITPKDKKTEMHKILLKVFSQDCILYDKECTSISRFVPEHIRQILLFYYDGVINEDTIYNLIRITGNHFAYLVKETETEYTFFIQKDDYYHNDFIVRNISHRSEFIDAGISFCFKVVEVPGIGDNFNYPMSKTYSNCYFTGLIRPKLRQGLTNYRIVDLRPFIEKKAFIDEVSNTFFPFIRMKSFWTAYTINGTFSSINNILENQDLYYYRNNPLTEISINQIGIMVPIISIIDTDDIRYMSELFHIPELMEYGITKEIFGSRFSFMNICEDGVYDAREVIDKLFSLY